MKRIIKRFFLEHFSNITNSNVIDKRVQLRKTKGCFQALNIVYIESVPKFHSSFKQKHTNASLSLFLTYNSYYCVGPTEKEKLSCVFINYLNSHLLRQLINIFRKSKCLLSHYSLTAILIVFRKEKVLRKLMSISPAN